MFAGQRWADAVITFSAAASTDRLNIEDLERFAAAAALVGQDELAAATWERAHLELLEAGELERAVRCAFWCAFGLMNTGQMARAGGWFGRAQRLLDDNDLDSVERGFLMVPAALRTLEGGDPGRALGIFEEVLAIGRRFDELDLIALGRLGQGRSLVLLGRDADGLALLDEAMVSVTAGELTPIIAGRVYCAVILVCQQAFDLVRAHEWTSALSGWCDAQPDIVPFRGQCLVHRSEVLQLHGDWAKAMDEAERARERLSDPPGQSATGMAFYQLGELYRLRGDFAEAEAAYREASGYGRTPQPGLSAMRLMQGDIEAAASAVRRVMDEPNDRVTRASLLSACVEIMLAAEDPTTAEEAGAELTDIASEVDAPLLHAMAAYAEAGLAFHRGDARAALDAAHLAAERWAQLEAPYERARSQVTVALACLDLGDRDTALFESDAARQTFETLGARPDLHRLNALFPRTDTPDPGGLTPRQLEVLVLVAAGRTNREIGKRLYISDHTVRRHLQNIFNRIGVTSRAAATAYAYEHGLL
jgi:DNA-binding CsgD family transcriptional regulator